MIHAAFRHHDKRLFARGVTALRGGDSAHCEAAIPMGGLSLCVSSSFLDDGVRGKMIDLRDPAKWRVYEVKPAIAPLDWLTTHNGKGYDLLGLAGILLPRVGDDADKVFCVEALAMIMGWDDPATWDLVRAEKQIAKAGPLLTWRDDKWRQA